MAQEDVDVTAVTRGVAAFQFADEDEGEDNFIVPVQEIAKPSNDLKLAMVGKFLTERYIRLNEMSQVMAMNWRPGKGVYIQEIAPQLFLFQFKHEADIRRIADGGPWAYDNHLLVFKRTSPGEDPTEVILDQVALWVQVHELPVGFMSDSIAQGIANKLGMFLESDPNNYTHPWRRYMRIRVSLDIAKPLKKLLNVKVEGGQWKSVLLKYERLPTFCFVCGRIGHSERFCKEQYVNAEGMVNRRFGPDLRAPTRRSSPFNLGDKWLLQEPVTTSNIKTRQSATIPTVLPVQQFTNGSDMDQGNKGLNGDVNMPAKAIIGSPMQPHVDSQDMERHEELGVIFIDRKRKRGGLEGMAHEDASSSGQDFSKTTDGPGCCNTVMAGSAVQTCPSP